MMWIDRLAVGWTRTNAVPFYRLALSTGFATPQHVRVVVVCLIEIDTLGILGSRLIGATATG